MRIRTSLLCLALLLAAAQALFAGGRGEVKKAASSEESIDWLGIAATMLRDGNLEKAASAIARVDQADPGFDRPRFYTVRGLVEFQRGEYAAAAADLKAARAAGQGDPRLLVTIAQAHMALEEHAAALEAFQQVEDFGDFPEALALVAQCRYRLGQPSEALAVLDNALAQYPDKSAFLRQRIFYLIELDLNRQAAEDSRRYLAAVSADPEAWITIGEAMRRGGEPADAVQVLEEAALRFPSSARVSIALAQAYLDRDLPRASATLLERAALSDPALYLDAAELYQRAGMHARALYINSLLVDSAQKARQRFGLLLKQGSFEEALALEPRLRRLGLMEDDALRYAVAYALYRTQRLDAAAEALNGIGSAEYFRQATQLRRAIEAARDGSEAALAGEAGP